MSPLRMQFDRIRQGIWLVVLVAVAAVTITMWSTLSAGTVYTGRAALSLGSQYRAPEQDAVLASGYADLFNEVSYQNKLGKDAPVPSGVVVSARTAAASPILYIEATSSDQAAARSTAAAMASAFLNDVNKSLQADKDTKVADLNAQIDVQRRLQNDAPRGSQESTVATTAIAALQTQIGNLRGDTTNQLQQLEPVAGVSAASPSKLVNGGLALVGGLIFGALAAIALAMIRGRLSSSAEVEDALRVPVLADIPGGRSIAAARDRDRQFKRLAHAAAPVGIRRPVVIAVVAPRRTNGVAVVAEAFARYRAEQGERSLLLRTDLHVWPDSDAGALGVADVITDPHRHRIVSLLRPGAARRMNVLPSGSSDEDPYSLFGQDRFTAVIRQAVGVADLVVIEVPPLLEAAESQAICAAAHRTILVVDAGATRAADALEALAMTRQVNTGPCGAVLLRRGIPDTEIPIEEKEPLKEPTPGRDPVVVETEALTHVLMQTSRTAPSPRQRTVGPAQSEAAERAPSR